MYDRKKYYQGEDIKFDFYILDKTKTKIDLSVFADIVLYIFNPADKLCSMVKIAKIAKDGYITMSQTSTTSYTATIDSGITEHLMPGQYVIEIDVTTTDSSLTDSRFNRIGKAEAFKLEHAIIKRESRLQV